MIEKPGLYIDLSARDYFADKFYIDAGGCWIWTGFKSAKGYGQLKYGRMNWLAHRFFYIYSIGEIPDGLVLDHLCRRRDCVNPGHLEPVENRENIMRGVGVAAVRAAQEFCKRGHPFDPDNTYYRPKHGGRRCRECHRITERERDARS